MRRLWAESEAPCWLAQAKGPHGTPYQLTLQPKAVAGKLALPGAGWALAEVLSAVFTPLVSRCTLRCSSMTEAARLTWWVAQCTDASTGAIRSRALMARLE